MLKSRKNKYSAVITTVHLIIYFQDITRIGHLVSKTVKSNIPCSDFGIEGQLDINAALSIVEDLIKLGKQSGDDQNDAAPQLSGESE